MTQDTMMRAFQKVQFNQRLQLAMAQARAQSAAQQRLLNAMGRPSHHHHQPLHPMAHVAVRMWPLVKEVTVMIDTVQRSRQLKRLLNLVACPGNSVRASTATNSRSLYALMR